LPPMSLLLAFWVVFPRPTAHRAWTLLLVLRAMSSISFEATSDSSFVGIYRNLFFANWALGMLLFGIYFPERWTLDQRWPWIKWILLVPLLFQALLVVSSTTRRLTGFNIAEYFGPLLRGYEVIGFYVNLIAIGLFFAILGHKSGTLENPDSRRRLKLLVWGTTIAMLPTFLIVLYKASFRVPGSFFQSVPFWFAIIALLLLTLFPLTLA